MHPLVRPLSHGISLPAPPSSRVTTPAVRALRAMGLMRAVRTRTATRSTLTLLAMCPLCAVTGLVGGSTGPHGAASLGRSGGADSARVVAWVDFDNDPARQVFAKFAAQFKTHAAEIPVPVTLKFVGSDVADDAHLLADMKRLTAQRPALIVATSAIVALTLKSLHSGIPVYFVAQSDPVRGGLVTSLSANDQLTGYTYFVPLHVKTMELIHRLFPDSRTVGIVTDPLTVGEVNLDSDLFEQGRAMGLNLVVFRLSTADDVRGLKQDRRWRDINVWYVPYGQLAFDHGDVIAETLAQFNAPTVYARRKFLSLGGLLSIQPIDRDAMEVWARSISNILTGVPVGSIPVMRPKEIEIAANAAAVSRLDPRTRDLIAREATIFE